MAARCAVHAVVAAGTVAVTVVVEPRFEFTKDRYEVRVRTTDCRVLTAKLVIEGAPIED